jgi:putative ABC transport system substrate-binding protein
MKRREFIGLLGGAAVAWPLGARTQQTDRALRVGVLMPQAEDDLEGQARITAFQDGMQKLGWRVGGNLQIDYRWAISGDEAARAATAELLTLAPDVIFASGTPALRAVQGATRTVSIVFTTIIEPVGQGIRRKPSLSRRQYHRLVVFGCSCWRKVVEPS